MFAYPSSDARGSMNCMCDIVGDVRCDWPPFVYANRGFVPVDIERRVVLGYELKDERALKAEFC